MHYKGRHKGKNKGRRDKKKQFRICKQEQGKGAAEEEKAWKKARLWEKKGQQEGALGAEEIMDKQCKGAEKKNKRTEGKGRNRPEDVLKALQDGEGELLQGQEIHRG